MIVSRISRYISFEDSRFAVQKLKENTARINLWRELKCDNVFTLEASFAGYMIGVSFIQTPFILSRKE